MVFREEARDMIRNIRSGNDASLNSGWKDNRSIQASTAAAGGPLPSSMYKAAREGRLVKRG